MCFKRSWLYALASLLVLIGCAGEKDPFFKPPEVKFDSPKFQCLVNAESTIGKFIDGALSNGEVQSFWNCLDLAIIQFVKFTRGSDGSRYTPQEIVSFLDTYFLDNRGLVKETAFLNEMMEVKKLFIGGTVTDVSHFDLYVRTREIISEFKAISLIVNPHMRVIGNGLSLSGRKSGLANSDIVEAEKALKEAGRRIGRLIQDRQQFYSFTHLIALLTEIEKIVKKTRPDFSVDTAKRYLPVMAELKGLLVSPPYDLIRSQDWGRLAQVVTDILSWMIRYRFDVEDQDWDQGQPLETIELIAAEVFDNIDKGLAAHPGREASFVDLDRFIEKLDDANLLPLDFDAKTTKGTIRQLVGRVLAGPGQTGSNGFNTVNLSVLKSEIFRWISAQRYLNSYLDTQALPAPDDGPAVEMAKMISASAPLVRDANGRLIFGAANAPVYNRDSLTSLNWQRAVIRALMRGYSDNSDINSVKGLTLDQLTLLGNDWHLLAEKLGLFDPGQAASMAKKIFMEANLFMPSANGDDSLDFVEATQYLAYGISGLNAADILFNELGQGCADPQAPKKLLPDCARKQMFVVRGQIFAHLPQLKNFIDRDGSQWLDFERMLEITTRDEGYTSTSLAKGDVVEIMVLLQYLETYFAVYDQDKNQNISVGETVSSFPVFRHSLDQIVRNSYGFDLSGSDLLALFTFLFKHGQPPQSTFGGMVKFLNWKWNRNKWSYDVDRFRVVQILAELNSRR